MKAIPKWIEKIHERSDKNIQARYLNARLNYLFLFYALRNVFNYFLVYIPWHITQKVFN